MLHMNVTPVFDTAKLAEAVDESFPSVCQELGVTVCYPMISDVSGHNWPLAEMDVLIDAGAVSMRMLGIPDVFLWEGLWGQSVPAWKGSLYVLRWSYGHGQDVDLLATRWPDQCKYSTAPFCEPALRGRQWMTVGSLCCRQ